MGERQGMTREAVAIAQPAAAEDYRNIDDVLRKRSWMNQFHWDSTLGGAHIIVPRCEGMREVAVANARVEGTQDMRSARGGTTWGVESPARIRENNSLQIHTDTFRTRSTYFAITLRTRAIHVPNTAQIRLNTLL